MTSPDLTTDSESKIYGEVCLRKQRRKRQKLLIIELLYEYAKNSTLHGLRYIVDRALKAYEKFFWLLTFIISMGMCFFLISKVYMKWENSPVIVSFSERVVPVGDVPFPSITICPEMKCRATVYNYTDNLIYYKNSGNDPEEKEFMWKNQGRLSDLYYLHDIDVACNAAIQVQTSRTLTNDSLVQHFLEVAPDADYVFFFCKWRGVKMNCKSNFKRILTAEGVCYNFNSLAADEILRMENLQKEYLYSNATKPSRDWSLAGGYSDYRINKTYPKRGRENNASPDLVVVLRESQKDRDNICNFIKSGYKIFVQHPADLPQSSLYYYAALHGQVSSLALKFNMLTTDEGLRSYTPQVRQCYFPEDKELRYFRLYTPNNCRLECQSNFTFKLCNCVWFHMPHNDSRQLCISGDSYKCMLDALDILSMAELKVKNKKENMKAPCECLPSCNSVQYDAEILKTQFNINEYLKSLQALNKTKKIASPNKNYSRIEVYFKEPRFISMRRSELYGITDFLAAVGGLLGLFLGFSFLSLVEIFYFITLRLYEILKRDLKEEKRNSIISR